MGAVLTPIPEWFKAGLRDFLATWRQPVTEHVPRAYWETLSDCEQADIEAAGLELRRSAGGEFPPSASTWHQLAIRIATTTPRRTVWSIFLDALPVSQSVRWQWFEPLRVEADDGRVLTVRADGIVIAYLARHHAAAIGDGLKAAGREAIEWVP